MSDEEKTIQDMLLDMLRRAKALQADLEAKGLVPADLPEGAIIESQENWGFRVEDDGLYVDCHTPGDKKVFGPMAPKDAVILHEILGHVIEEYGITKLVGITELTERKKPSNPLKPPCGDCDKDCWSTVDDGKVH